MLERWPGYNEQSWAQRFAELDRQFSKERDTAVRAICQLSSQTSARITALETALAKARNAALEEAAKVAETNNSPYDKFSEVGPETAYRDACDTIAQAIRDMKDSHSPSPPAV